MRNGAAAGALLLALLLATTVSAQAPDCTGISDVSNFDGATVGPMNGVLTTVRVASGLLRPLFVSAPPGDLERLFIVEQDGTVRILKNGSLLATPFLDISALVQSPSDGWANEEGLLGFAFDPDYATNGRFYVYYTGNGGTNYSNWVDRFSVSEANPDLADPASRVNVIEFPHPTATYHHGGMLAFGPLDGRLYIGVGDGALAPCDPAGNGQSLDTNYGKMLRLDVSTLPYGTTGNPYDGVEHANDEIWYYGLRNPFRFSFDRETGALLIGDVGQVQWEEIDCIPPTSSGGENFGWDHYEGLPCPNASCGSQGDCDVNDYRPPILQYSLAGPNCTVIGGYVYRGCRMSDLHGTYFYADNCSAIIESFRTDASCSVTEELSRAADLNPGGGLSIAQITSFGEDARGELYIVDRAGEVFKILPTLSILEVSGENAVPFQLGGVSGDWSWEDLAASSSHPVTRYKVYRSSLPQGTFSCVHLGLTTSWAGGDPETPASGQVAYYLVTGMNGTGEETSAGYHSDGTARHVDTGSSCN
jgi:glucose/arabinose dehydrogenase